MTYAGSFETEKSLGVLLLKDFGEKFVLRFFCVDDVLIERREDTDNLPVVRPASAIAQSDEESEKGRTNILSFASTPSIQSLISPSNHPNTSAIASRISFSFPC